MWSVEQEGGNIPIGSSLPREVENFKEPWEGHSLEEWDRVPVERTLYKEAEEPAVAYSGPPLELDKPSSGAPLQ